MRLRKCKKCGRPFEADTPDTVLCPECSIAYFKSATVRDRVCRQCGITFSGGPRAWYCPSCRTDRRREADRKQKRSGAARPLGSTDICKRCGNEYIVESGRQMYCKDCADIAVSETVRAHKREYNHENKVRLNARKHYMRSNRNICVVCGNVFDPDTPTVTCSDACAEKLCKLRQEEADYRRGKRKTLPGIKYDSGLPKSGIVGVTARRNGKWQAAYKGHYIGIYDTAPEAAEAIEKYKEDLSDDR